jgi:hypothetical protein
MWLVFPLPHLLSLLTLNFFILAEFKSKVAGVVFQISLEAASAISNLYITQLLTVGE